MTFTTRPLEGGGFLVEGTDSKGVDGATVLRSKKWDEVLATRAYVQATTVFNEQAAEFFKPLTDAADAARAAATTVGAGYRKYIITTGVNGVDAVSVTLDKKGVLLRLLDEGRDDLLQWVNGELVAIRA